MHSIVVLGDVRTHNVMISSTADYWRDELNCDPPGQPLSVSFYGGALMMRNAVETAIHDADLGKTVPIYSFQQLPNVHTGELVRWELRPFDKLLKLKPEGVLETNLEMPALDDLLQNTTYRNHPYETVNLQDKDGNSVPFNAGWTDEELRAFADLNPWSWCPDVVVIDDLNLTLRTLDVRAAAPNAANDTGKEQLRAALDALLNRFERAKAKADRSKTPIMEPVIVASIKGKPHHALSSSDAKNFWKWIHDDPWLRLRTIVLLDADDMREAGLPVSSGLSWERTAQDTISELRRSSDFRRFLDFGQVIVRYGATGALHIVSRGSADWTYRLYFLYHEHDGSWMRREHGQLLGFTSIYTASLTVGLIKKCKEYGGRPYLGDLPEVIAATIPDAIQRCCFFCQAAAYGKTTFHEFVNRYRNVATLFPVDLFKSKQEAESETQVRYYSIATASVPAVKLRNWSIVGQAIQGRVGEVARDIVLYGADYALNLPVLDDAARNRAFKSAILEAQSQTEIDPSAPGRKRDLWADVRMRLIQKKTDEIREVLEAYSQGQIDAAVVPIDGRGSTPWRRFEEFIEGARFEKWILNQLAEEENELSTRINAIITSPVVREPVPAALASFGEQGKKLIIVDRREVEGFRAIEKLMRQHLQEVQNKRNERPLSLAVFGPPGSGKSTAVKKINEGLSASETKVLEPFNLAQFKGPEDLEKAFDKIVAESLGNKVPIVFFDEFDCRFPGDANRLGWLKFFLSPMEDGLFGDKEVKKAILVFAGGTSSTFAEFSLAERSRTDEQWIEFSGAKGPDFVSRLRGHLDIVGINPTDVDDEVNLIRRAVVIRYQLTVLQGLTPGEKARIDEEMIRALLHVPEYWHGARAARMLLNLCSTDRLISASAVPPIHQINMLVDGKAFLDQLQSVAHRKD